MTTISLPPAPPPDMGGSYRFVAPRTATTPKVVRDLVTTLVIAFGHEDIADQLRLCVSEVVTNAYRHTRAAHIAVDVSFGTDNVTVWVDDGPPGWLPRVPHPEPPWRDESGRGLYLVSRVADRLGVDADDEGVPRLGFSIGYEGA
ncbi:ATP-binding protein [Streptomyces sp. AB3(2024)]|uniref:ATP-binding protein n=1 Tax=Streptomyces sp. AB3(2024) TaxID=3317321 RepID=UPI0035A2C4D0